MLKCVNITIITKYCITNISSSQKLKLTIYLGAGKNAGHDLTRIRTDMQINPINIPHLQSSRLWQLTSSDI